jgi:hypothetical protein
LEICYTPPVTHVTLTFFGKRMELMIFSPQKGQSQTLCCLPSSQGIMIVCRGFTDNSHIGLASNRELDEFMWGSLSNTYV